ncbi:MAG: hypothetical protein WAN66_04690 [Limnoraphis robusta]
MITEQLFFNGINGGTGEYLLPPLTPEQIAKIAQGQEEEEEKDPEHRAHLDELKAKDRHVKGIEPQFAPIEGVDRKNLAETGWGVIFAHDADPGIKDALSPLLKLRKQQATQKNEKYYRELTYRAATASKPAESKDKFLARYEVGPGPADPNKMSYYLLIVGDPEKIPYRFQYQLDVQYAVGRIYFDDDDPDKYEKYRLYAESVVAAETGKVSRNRNATFFGVRNSADQATQLSADNLIKPLAELMAKDQPNWTVQTVLKDETTKAKLGQLLGGSETPSLLFTATHGMGFDNGHPLQLRHQGALICQDWPGPLEWRKPFIEDFYFSCDDVSDNAQLQGLIAFHFACYGGGTPKFDEFAHKDAFGTRGTIAPKAFIARLPQRLLGHPEGGALAVVGHVERAWGCSFVWQNTGQQLAVFQSALKRLMEGHPVGSAIEYFNERYAELSSDLSTVLEDIEYGAEVPALSLAGMWTANNDARSYCIIGDPAVRLPLGDGAEKQAVIERVNLPTTPSTDETVEDVEETGVDPSVLKQAQADLINSLEKFLETVQPASATQAEKLKATVSDVEDLLNKLKQESE